MSPSILAPFVYSREIIFRLLRRVSKLFGLINFHDALLEKYNYDESVFHQKRNCYLPSVLDLVEVFCWSRKTNQRYFLNLSPLMTAEILTGSKKNFIIQVSLCSRKERRLCWFQTFPKDSSIILSIIGELLK
jgi:hypothetical protein